MLSTHMQNFIAMGGYAKYVWSAYAIAAVIIMGNVFYSRIIHKRVLKKLRRYQQRQQSI